MEVAHQQSCRYGSLAVFPANPCLPMLAMASNPELMREVFANHLRPITSKRYHIKDCALSCVRYREAARCVLQYTLSLVEPETGQEQKQWASGVIYADGRTEPIFKRLHATDPVSEIPETLRTFEPVCFIPDLEMLVQVFPYDRRFRALPLLMAKPSPDLMCLLLAQFGPGEWRAERCKVEPIRYRAELGAVLRYTLQAHNSLTNKRETRRFYVKLYRDGAGAQIYHVLHSLYGKAETTTQGFTVGRPVAYLSDVQALFQEEAPGISLRDIIINGHETTSAVRSVARALAAFNQRRVVTARRHLLEDEIAALDRARRLLQWSSIHLRAEVEVIVDAIIAGLHEVTLGPTHRDLKPEHILLDRDNLALLDLDIFAEADPVLDPASLLAEFAATPLSFPIPQARAREASWAFAEEYFAHVPSTWRNRLPLHYAGAALKVAVGFFRRQEPNWSGKVAALIEEAKKSLEGRLW